MSASTTKAAVDGIPTAGGKDLALSDQTLRILEHRRRTHGVRRRGWLMRRVLLAADVIGLTLAGLLTWALYGSQGAGDSLSVSDEASLLALTLPVWLLTAKLFGLYDFDEERADHTTSDLSLIHI